jgi:hypothetical protein
VFIHEQETHGSRHRETTIKDHRRVENVKLDPVETGKMGKIDAERHSLNQRVYPYSSRKRKRGRKKKKKKKKKTRLLPPLKVPKSLGQSNKPLRLPLR